MNLTHNSMNTMDSKHFSSFHNIPLFVIFLFFFFFFFISPSLAVADTPSIPVAPNDVCNSALDPKYCKSVLPHNVSWNPNDYSRFSALQSLSTARNFLALVDKYLTHPSTLSKTAIQALKDCQLLAGLNIDFLLRIVETLDSTKSPHSLQALDVQTLLSAILTNQETCLDCLQATTSAWNFTNGLHTRLSNGTRLYSVALALFKHAWVHKTNGTEKSKPERMLMFSDMEGSRYGRIPLRLLRQSRDFFKSASRRKILEAPLGVAISDIVVVNPDGSGNFTTVNDAVAAAPNNTDISNGYFLIQIVAGVYEEYVSIAKNKNNLMMIGDGKNQTVITGNRSVGDGWSTFNSATFIVVGKGFVATDITFRNTAGPSKGQAVAVRNGADLSTFYNCSFEGYQDTLYAHSLRQFYRECDIYGTVDFIFGNAAVVFQNCNMYARLPIRGQSNEITAQGRSDPNQNTGTYIQNCSIRAADDLASSNSTAKTFLGRPWKEYSRTVIMQSFIDKLIDPAGWNAWSGDFALSSLYYAEYNNTGPRSNTSNRVTWTGYHIINATNATTFTVSNFIGGDAWLPPTGVPYCGGLI